MKTLKLLFLLSCLCILSSYAQDNFLYQEIQRTKSSGEKFEPVSALTLANKSASQSQKIQEHFINPQEVHFLHYSTLVTKQLNASMTFHIPLGSKNLQLELKEFVMEYRVTTSSGETLPQNRNIRHYHGIVKGDPNSVVAITFGEDEIIGLVATDEGNFNLAFDKQSGEHIFYNDKNLKQKKGFICATQTDDGFEGYDPEILFQNSRLFSLSDRTVRFYCETTFDIFLTRGNVAAVETFISGLYNQVAVLYRNESITVALSQIHVWDTLDPYANIPIVNNSLLNLSNYLVLFQIIRTSFNGDLGQLVTFRNLGVTILGGVAAGINGLCNDTISKKLSVAQIADVNNFPNVPTYSESVSVTTHELGHLFGSQHTHACVWNGNNTAIDGCEKPEGNCPKPAIPANGGTIMSYCDLPGGPGIDFNLGFGAQPGNVIRYSVIKATCLPTFSAPYYLCHSGVARIENLPAGATIAWSSVNGNLAFSSATADSVVVTSNAYNVPDTIVASIQHNNITAFTMRHPVHTCGFNIEADDYSVSCTPHRFTAPLIAGASVSWTYHSSISVKKQASNYIDITVPDTLASGLWLAAKITDNITGAVLATDSIPLPNHNLKGIYLEVIGSWFNTYIQRVQYGFNVHTIPANISYNDLCFTWRNKDISNKPAPVLGSATIQTGGNIYPADCKYPGIIGLAVSPPIIDSTLIDSLFRGDIYPYIPTHLPDWALVTLPAGTYSGTITCTVKSACGASFLQTCSISTGGSKAIYDVTNPVTETITLNKREEIDTYDNVNPNDEVEIMLYSTFMPMHKRKAKMSENQVQISTAGLPKGSYYLTVTKNGQLLQSQIIIKTQ